MFPSIDISVFSLIPRDAFPLGSSSFLSSSKYLFISQITSLFLWSPDAYAHSFGA